MSDYIVKDTELTSVANAIRIKGGTNSQLVFPNGFVSAIGNISGGGGSWQTVFEGSVTTSDSQEEVAEGTINYSEQITTDTIKVTFTGTEYECSKITMPFGGYAYGGIGEQGYDFSEYPFVIMSGEGTEQTIVNTFITQTAGTYTLKIEEEQSGGSSDFSTAEVTYPNGMPRQLPLAIILDDEIQVVPSGSSATAGTYTFVLYKGKVFLHDFDADYLNQDGYSTSGNITYDSEGAQYVITGDFTVAAPQ